MTQLHGGGIRVFRRYSGLFCIPQKGKAFQVVDNCYQIWGGNQPNGAFMSFIVTIKVLFLAIASFLLIRRGWDGKLGKDFTAATAAYSNMVENT